MSGVANSLGKHLPQHVLRAPLLPFRRATPLSIHVIQAGDQPQLTLCSVGSARVLHSVVVATLSCGGEVVAAHPVHMVAGHSRTADVGFLRDKSIGGDFRPLLQRSQLSSLPYNIRPTLRQRKSRRLLTLAEQRLAKSFALP